MKLLAWKHWGIGGRLVTIAVAPATLMFLVISLALYFSGHDQIRSDIRERGGLLAAALAESSRYAVVSGNTAPLNETLRGLLALDPSLIAIEILDVNHAVIVSVGDTNSPLSELQVLEVVMRAQVPDIDLFDKAGGPHVSAPAATISQFSLGAPVGYVRVVMSALPILEAKRRPVYVSLAVVLLAALFSAVAGLYLAQRLRQPLNAVVTALRGIREGNYEVQLDRNERGELGELQATIVEMARALRTARQELENQVAIRTRELQSAIELANAAGEEKRRLIAQGNTLIEEERRRIAIEIHDHLNASLIFVQLEVQRIASLAATLESARAQEIADVARRISETTADLYSAARAIVKQLRPEVIDTLGLKGAVQEMIRAYDAAHPGCRFVLRADPDFPKLSSPLTIAAYRVIQEALSNVVKHAHASSAAVTLSGRSGRSTCSITIEDDGVGFEAEKSTVAGIGLIGIRERVTGVGGSIQIASGPASGTRIAIELPVQQESSFDRR